MSSEFDYAKLELPRFNQWTENSMSMNTIGITNIDERKLLRKIDLRVLPDLVVIYVLGFLDR